MVKFKYNNKVYETPNLEKKLRRLKITIDDIEILEDNIPIIEEDDIEEVKLYHFINKDNGYRHCSIYDKCPEGYIKCDKNGNICNNTLGS